MEVTQIWTLWQELVQRCSPGCTSPGYRHFLRWVTGLALNVEEHTITQSLIGIDCAAAWKGVESFAEYGAWDGDVLEEGMAELIDEAPGRVWHGYRVWAVDDTKVHRNSKNVWGTCTFHEYTARCPNRATTVRAHNWVVLGALLANPGQPAWFVPHSGRLYFRKSQLPHQQGNQGPLEPFHTKCALAVAQLRQAAAWRGERHLATFDGAFAVASVVRPLVLPEAGQARIDFLTRLRHDARLYALPSAPVPGQRGPRRKWGKLLPPPRCGGRWPGAWQQGQAFVYGRLRQVRWKEMLCLWRVLGHAVTVKVVVAEVEGYRKRFPLVTSATDLTGLQLVELFAARFRQEDGFRDLKQRLGWEEGKAWTKKPLLRTTQALFVVMLLLRLLHFRLDEQAGSSWWFHPPWNKHKTRASILDVERVLRQHRAEIQQLLADRLEKHAKATKAHANEVGM